jgi:hypothetical protein
MRSNGRLLAALALAFAAGVVAATAGLAPPAGRLAAQGPGAGTPPAAQPPPFPSPAPHAEPARPPEAPRLPPAPQPTQEQPRAPRTPGELIEHIRGLRAQKAKLDAAEREAVKQLKGMLAQQRDALKELGLDDAAPQTVPQAIPPRSEPEPGSIPPAPAARPPVIPEPSGAGSAPPVTRG